MKRDGIKTFKEKYVTINLVTVYVQLWVSHFGKYDYEPHQTYLSQIFFFLANKPLLSISKKNKLKKKTTIF